MIATFAHSASHAASQSASSRVIARILAAVRAAMARAKARHEYRRLLDCDETIMRDAGVTRDEVRRALTESGGRP